jgi:hypothetical protein
MRKDFCGLSDEIYLEIVTGAARKPASLVHLADKNPTQKCVAASARASKPTEGCVSGGGSSRSKSPWNLGKNLPRYA